MSKRIHILLLAPALLVILVPPTRGQTALASNSSPAAVNATDRERDGLTGHVRRVRTETAKIVNQNGKYVEGARAVNQTATYDLKGKRIEEENFATDGAPPTGRETYKYDAKGNIIEMQMLDAAGSVINQEIYAYEYDALGNWTKMTTSVPVVESGKPTDEPSEVTYRTITYYRTPEVAKAILSAPSQEGTPAAPQPPPGVFVATSKTTPIKPTPPAATPSPSLSPGIASPNSNALASVPARQTAAEPSYAGAGDGGSSFVNVANSSSAPTIPSYPLKDVTGETLRQAAITIPDPVYPTGAIIGRVEGKVNVRVMVTEKGEVASARAVSGHPLLSDAAEQAALRARFSPAQISPEPAVVFGEVSYVFDYPSASATYVAPPSAIRAATPPAEGATAAPSAEARAINASTTTNRPSPTGTSNVAPTTTGTGGTTATGIAPPTAAEYAQVGIDFSKSGRHKEAVKAFKEAARLAPDDHVIHNRLGASYLALRRPADAIEEFKKVVKIKPDADDAHYHLGISFYELGRYRDAIKAFQNAIAVKEKVAEYHFGLGLSHLAAQENGAADKQRRILGELNPQMAKVISDALRVGGTRGILSNGNLLDRLRTP